MYLQLRHKRLMTSIMMTLLNLRTTSNKKPFSNYLCYDFNWNIWSKEVAFPLVICVRSLNSNKIQCNHLEIDNQILIKCFLLYWGCDFLLLQIYVQHTPLFCQFDQKDCIFLATFTVSNNNGYPSITIKKMSFDIANERWTIVV